jgi:2-polyprenyl-6-hydroxyphenyl methylase/3-demethylubiquinone-9 3-methyltransferase
MINNEFYKDLGQKWYTSEGDAVALLRRENEVKAPWVIEKIKKFHQNGARVLDAGCGGGFLTLKLASEGYKCTGLDVGESVFLAAKEKDFKNEIQWSVGSVENLPFASKSFDVVCMMDVLEHVSNPKQAVQEALRVLDSNGTFLYHTFNRTWLSWLLAAKGLNWFVPNSPENIHDWNMFIRPEELESWLNEANWNSEELTGIHPQLRSVFSLLLKRKVSNNFHFKLGGSLQVGYIGCARTSLNKLN